MHSINFAVKESKDKIQQWCDDKTSFSPWGSYLFKRQIKANFPGLAEPVVQFIFCLAK